MPTIIDKINQEQLKKDTAQFNVGDSVTLTASSNCSAPSSA